MNQNSIEQIANHRRPLITFAIIAYNQEKYIHEAVHGAFSQTYSPLEIILSDDCSRDGTFKIIESLANAYQGPHKVILNRNNENLGLGGHVNKIVELSSGELIVMAAGDDISLPGRVDAGWKLLAQNKDCYCLSFSRVIIKNDLDRKEPEINEKYECIRYSLADFLEKINQNRDLPMYGASRVFRKSIFDYFGPLLPKTPTEDSTILLRCLLAGQVLKSEEPQIFYRIHGDNYSISKNKFFINYEEIHNQYIKDLQKALEIGFINKTQFGEIEKHLVKKSQKIKLRSEFYQTDSKLQIFLTSILFSSYFGLEEKWKFLKKAFL